MKCVKGNVYEFKEGQEYSARVNTLGFSEIGIDSTRVTVTTTWLLSKFRCTRKRWSKKWEKESDAEWQEKEL